MKTKKSKFGLEKFEVAKLNPSAKKKIIGGVGEGNGNGNGTADQTISGTDNIRNNSSAKCTG